MSSSDPIAASPAKANAGFSDRFAKKQQIGAGPQSVRSVNQPGRRLILALIMVAPLIAGCSFSPLYGNAAAPASSGFAYDEPTSRVEQIIYQDLAARLGTSTMPGAPRIEVHASTSARRVGRTSGGSVFSLFEKTINGTVIVRKTTDKQEILFKQTRDAGASYEISGQAFADRSAQNTADAQAAHALAETFVLLILGADLKPTQ